MCVCKHMLGNWMRRDSMIICMIYMYMYTHTYMYNRVWRGDSRWPSSLQFWWLSPGKRSLSNLRARWMTLERFSNSWTSTKKHLRSKTGLHFWYWNLWIYVNFCCIHIHLYKSALHAELAVHAELGSMCRDDFLLWTQSLSKDIQTWGFLAIELVFIEE